MELVAQPACLMLDEPTSGLDSSTAHQVIAELRSLANTTNCTSLAVIHQPRWETLQLFDQLVLLAPGGMRRMAFRYFLLKEAPPALLAYKMFGHKIQAEFEVFVCIVCPESKNTNKSGSSSGGGGGSSNNNNNSHNNSHNNNNNNNIRNQLVRSIGWGANPWMTPCIGALTCVFTLPPLQPVDFATAASGKRGGGLEIWPWGLSFRQRVPCRQDCFLYFHQGPHLKDRPLDRWLSANRQPATVKIL